MIGMFNVRNAKKLDSEIQMSQDPLNQLESNFLCIIFHPRLVIGIAVEHLLLKRTLTILNSFSAKSGHFNRNQSPVKTIWQTENIQIGVQIWRTFGAKMTADDMPCPWVKCWSQGLSASRACIDWDCGGFLWWLLSNRSFVVHYVHCKPEGLYLIWIILLYIQDIS